MSSSFWLAYLAVTAVFLEVIIRVFVREHFTRKLKRLLLVFCLFNAAALGLARQWPEAITFTAFFFFVLFAWRDDDDGTPPSHRLPLRLRAFGDKSQRLLRRLQERLIPSPT